MSDAWFNQETGRFLTRGPGPVALEEAGSGARRPLAANGIWHDSGHVATLSPDASAAAVVSYSLGADGTIEDPLAFELWTLGQEPRARRLAEGGADVQLSEPVWSLRGDRVAIVWASEPSVRVWSAATGALVQELKDFSSLVGFASTGELIVAPGPDENLRLVAPDGAAREIGLPRFLSDPWSISASRERLAILVQAGEASEGEPAIDAVLVYDLVAGRLLRRVPCVPRKPARTSFGWTECGSVALSPHGDLLALAFWDGSVEVWELPP